MWLSRKRSAERIEHRRGMLRVLAYGTVVGIVCAGFSVRAARAEVADQSIVVGRKMMELANTSRNDVSKVILNGQTMFFASSLTDDAPDQVLARYEDNCRKNAAQSPESWRGLATDAAKADATKAAQNDTMAQTGGVLRGGSGEEGTLICFVKSSSSKSTLSEALTSFQQTGELSALGMLRFVYVKKSQSGGAHILAAWTLEKFNVKEMMPEEDQDVPGNDFSEIPRPTNSVRTFSAYLDGTPYGVNMYLSNESPQAVTASFDATLTKQGWFALDIEGPAKRADESLKGMLGRVYERDGVLLTVATGVEGNKTMTAIGLAGLHERESRR